MGRWCNRVAVQLVELVDRESVNVALKCVVGGTHGKR